MRQTFGVILFIIAVSEITVADVRIENKFQLTTDRAYFSTVQAENKLYFIGGYEHSDYVASNIIDVLDLASGSWLPPLNLSTPRGHISSIVIDKKIYMVGGVSYSCLPYVYSLENNNFTTEGMTSGPTVRRPIRVALHDTTLTVIGAYSVDFMNTTTKKWTHNAQISSLMSTIFDAITISHNNFVFVVGGANVTSQLPITTVWVVDSPTSTPEEFRDKTQPVSSSMFVGSWFDEDHSSVVIRFTNQCLVYHTLTQTWFHRETNNNSITSVSYQNSTIVFFSDGYWTIDWLSMSDTWTSADQIDFAFTIGDQLVYFGGQQMIIVTTDAPIVTQPAEIGSITLSTSMTSSIYVLVNNNSVIFMYSSDSKQLTVVNTTLPYFTPVSIFSSNSLVHYFCYIVRSNVAYTSLITIDRFGAYQTWDNIAFTPQVLIDDKFVAIAIGKWAMTSSPTVVQLSTSISSPILWAQQDNQLYVMQTANVSPLDIRPYAYVDVFDFVKGIWENPIDIPIVTQRDSYLQVTSFNDTLCLLSSSSLYQLNSTGGWNNGKLSTKNIIAHALHPTYAPTLTINETIYVPENNGDGIYLIQSATDLRKVSPNVGLDSRLMVTSATKIVLSFGSPLYFSLAIYDIASGTWQSTVIDPGQSMVSVLMYDDVLLALGDDIGSLSYWNIDSKQWTKLPFDNSYVPASMLTLPPTSTNNKTVLVIAGGYHRTSRHYTDSVRFVTIDAQANSDSPSGSITDSPHSPVNVNSSTIIVAVVVPVGTIAIAAVLLAVLLIRRRRQRRRRQHSTIIGLEQQFGEWFVPFSDIHFGPQLGQGANGQVFKGKWKNTDVALKVSMTQANQSVISELSLMINMRPHPNVVQLFGFSVHPETNSVILIIEYCNDGSLDTMISEAGGDLAISKKLYWLKSIAKGLSHLHANNIIHRDIAARNVLLHQGEPKLTDFGMSRIVDSQQQRGTTKSELGPIRWMSPESLSLKQYSTKSDVWSFGILMFEILAQQEPHVDEDPIEVGRKIRDEGLVPQLPSSLECLSDFTSIMNQCCSVDPNNRASIEQVLQKLEQISL